MALTGMLGHRNIDNRGIFELSSTQVIDIVTYVINF